MKLLPPCLVCTNISDGRAMHCANLLFCRLGPGLVSRRIGTTLSVTSATVNGTCVGWWICSFHQVWLKIISINLLAYCYVAQELSSDTSFAAASGLLTRFKLLPKIKNWDVKYWLLAT